MKILLVRPPARYTKGSTKPSTSLPLGLLYIASVLEKNAYSIEIYDAQIKIDLPISYEQDGDMHLGDCWESVKGEIAKRKPDLVGITCPFTTQIESAIKTAEITKKINKTIITVVGGSHASARPADFFLKTDAVDLVCVGEGEYVFLDIAKALANKKSLEDIPGTVERYNDGVKINRARPYIQDLDELPLPAYHLVNMEDYFKLYKDGFSGRPAWHYPGSERTVSLITSRGCPFNCVFCSIHIHMGRMWRHHSSEYVLKHIEFLVSKYGAKHIHFEDDNLTLNIDRFKEILQGLVQGNINITWDTPNGIRVDTMTEEALRYCKKSGCTYLIFGIESGNQEVLDKIICKQLKLENVVQVAKWCNRVSLDAMSFFVIGFPGETKEDMQDSVDFALWLYQKYAITPTLFIATPLPGTRLEKICLEKKIIRVELSAGELAKMTQGTILMDGDTYSAQDISFLMKRFYKGYKIIFIYSGLLFLISHPKIVLKFIFRLFNEKKYKTKKEAILNMLEFKNCLKTNLPYINQ